MAKKRLTEQEAIKKKCLECSTTKSEVINCEIIDCPLWRYRKGYEEQDELYFKHMNKKR